MSTGMLQRCRDWDYTGRRIYMVTFTTEGRAPLLGELVGGESDARIEPTWLGRVVEQCWKSLPEAYPQVSLLEYQVMPDHFHGIIFVREKLPKPLGALVGTVKAHSTAIWKREMLGGMLGGMLGASASQHHALGGAPVVLRAACGERPPAACGERPPAACGERPPAACERFWSPGFQDTILFQDGQLAKMRAYVRDNPRRLAVKRAHPDLFRIVRDLPLCDVVFAAIGNHFLLDRPEKVQIQCSRRISPEALATEQARVIAFCRKGAVAVSPCISPGEKQIARAVMDAGLPLIVLLENGFPPLYKPQGKYFEACSAGRLLMLAPWPYHSDRRVIKRAQCLQLNEYAKRIAG